MSVSSPAWWAVIGVAWIAAIGPGDIEGRVLPAVTPMEITAQRPADEGYVYFDATTNRLRPECNFHKVEWFLGERGEAHVPTEVRPEKPTLRPETGVIDLKNWSVYVANLSIENTFADVLHKCMIGPVQSPWIVRSKLHN